MEKTLDDFKGKEILAYVAENFSAEHVLKYFKANGKIQDYHLNFS